MLLFFISHAKNNPGKSLTKGSGFCNDLLKSMVWDQGWEKNALDSFALRTPTHFTMIY